MIDTPQSAPSEPAIIHKLFATRQQFSELKRAADTDETLFFDCVRNIFGDEIYGKLVNQGAVNIPAEVFVFDQLPLVNRARLQGDASEPVSNDPVRLAAYKAEWIASRRREWLSANGPCECGSWENLEVHHINPAEKTTHRIWSWSEERRNAELAKCQPLCRECHKKETKANYVVHGKITRYRKGCRCELCVSAYEAFKLSRRKPQ